MRVRSTRLAALAAVPLLLLTACGPPEISTLPKKVDRPAVDVDTPELRQAKQAAGVEDCVPGEGPKAADGLPDVVLPCLGGGADVNLSELKGPAVVNLFAQWCGPCRSEMPYYQRLHEKAGDEVSVIGVDYLDPQPGRALELVEQTGVTYPLLADPDGELRDDLRVRGLPGVVLLDADGRVVDVQYRVVRSYEELRTLVQAGLDVPVPR